MLRRAAATGIAFASLLLSPVSVNAAQGAEMAGPWKQILFRNNSDGTIDCRTVTVGLTEARTGLSYSQSTEVCSAHMDPYFPDSRTFGSYWDSDAW